MEFSSAYPLAHKIRENVDKGVISNNGLDLSIEEKEAVFEVFWSWGTNATRYIGALREIYGFKIEERHLHHESNSITIDGMYKKAKIHGITEVIDRFNRDIGINKMVDAAKWFVCRDFASINHAWDDRYKEFYGWDIHYFMYDKSRENIPYNRPYTKYHESERLFLHVTPYNSADLSVSEKALGEQKEIIGKAILDELKKRRITWVETALRLGSLGVWTNEAVYRYLESKEFRKLLVE